MMYEHGRPDTMPSDCEHFRREFSPYFMEKVINRDESRLPQWFVPLARGVVIACYILPRKAGHCPGMFRPRGTGNP